MLEVQTFSLWVYKYIAGTCICQILFMFGEDKLEVLLKTKKLGDNQRFGHLLQTTQHCKT